MLAFLVLAAVVAGWLGSSYIGRLSDHAGFWLVPLENTVGVPLVERPRRAVLIVVDGLRRDAAETMDVTRTLGAAGQCRVMNQGSWTVSRPVYATMSTGVEVDRSGVRNNDDTSPLAAESIWQVARRSGWRVHGSSHLPWWKELFPDGFDAYATARDKSENVFLAPLGELSLYHPLYVDEAGHHDGGFSRAYDAAVRRADREIAGLLAHLDLERDLVVFTSDHGHLARGGHGGTQREVAEVLTCFAGPHVVRRTDRPTMSGQAMSAALSLFLGVPFPRHMRAGEDRLDEVFGIADLPDDYLADRRATVERFRAASEATLAGWLGGAPGTWSRLYARERAHHDGRFAVAGIVLVIGLFLGIRREPARMWLWLLLSLVAIWVAHRLVLGPLEFSAINLKERFVPKAFAATFLAAGGATFAHRWTRRPFAPDQVTLVAVLLYLNVAHVPVFGWPLGFPLPSPSMRYVPFFLCFAAVGNAMIGLVATLRRPR